MPGRERRSAKEPYVFSSRVDRILRNHSYDAGSREIGNSNLSLALDFLEGLSRDGEIIDTLDPSKKQKKRGIDIFCVVQNGDETMKVPVKVTSNLRKVRVISERHETDSIILAVGPDRDKMTLKDIFMRLLKAYVANKNARSGAEVAEVVNAPV